MPPPNGIPGAGIHTSRRWKVALGLGVTGLLVTAAFPGFENLPFLETVQSLDSESLHEMIGRAGLWGPLLIVVLMVVAVVASPLPSAPIALAAGATYGHLMGSLYVLTGAELGALIAFLIARRVGREPLQRWFGDRLDMGLLRSQTALTYTVFVTRLMPFISFDLISYAAGLSSISFWRFGLATLAGIVPASFLLAHFGDMATRQDSLPPVLIALALGFATEVPSSSGHCAGSQGGLRERRHPSKCRTIQFSHKAQGAGR